VRAVVHLRAPVLTLDRAADLVAEGLERELGSDPEVDWTVIVSEPSGRSRQRSRALLRAGTEFDVPRGQPIGVASLGRFRRASTIGWISASATLLVIATFSWRYRRR
jgi:hypothetical protein